MENLQKYFELRTKFMSTCSVMRLPVMGRAKRQYVCHPVGTSLGKWVYMVCLKKKTTIWQGETRLVTKFAMALSPFQYGHAHKRGAIECRAGC